MIAARVAKLLRSWALRLRCTALCLLLVACSTVQTGPVRADAELESRLNVVIFLVDDLGWRDVGFMGSQFYETPNIDRLAESSVVFTQAYSASPVCSPSRAALQTGRDPVRLGITDWIPGQKAGNDELLQTPEVASALALEEVTLGELFKQAGYATAHVGKWHIGGEGFLPQDQGYDVNIGGAHFGSPQGRPRGRAYWAPHNNPELAEGAEGEFLMARLAEETSAFIRANRENRFLAVHSFYAVHTPINAIPDYVERYQTKVGELGNALAPRETRYGHSAKAQQDDPAYASMLSAMDEAVGEVLDTIHEQGLEDRTIIIFTSDNGGLSAIAGGRREPPTSNEPLRASKGWLYEGGIRVPLLIRAPGVRSTTRTSVPATTIDIAPTALDLAGLGAAPDADGISLRSALAGDSGPARPLYWHYPHYHASGWRPGGAIRHGRYKLLEFFEDDAVELYDLEADPGEARNLTSERPELAAYLLAKLRDWRREVGVTMPVAREVQATEQ